MKKSLQGKHLELRDETEVLTILLVFEDLFEIDLFKNNLRSVEGILKTIMI